MIKIKTAIRKSRHSHTTAWLVDTIAIDEGDARYIMGTSDIAVTFKDAFEVAAEQREAIDGMLMDSIYRDRMTRRDNTEPCVMCVDELTGPITMRCTCELIDMFHAIEHPHPALIGFGTCPAFTPDQNTIEATA